MHASWRRYIADSLQRWTQFAEKFAKDDQELAERVKAARDRLSKTKEEVDNKKAALEEEDEDEHIEVSDEEMPERVDGSENIQASITSMVSNLQTLHKQAEEAIVEAGENKAKRPRIEGSGEGGAEIPVCPTPSMQPFAKPGK